MSKPGKPKQKPRYVVRYKMASLEDGSDAGTETVPLKEHEAKLLRQYQAMADSDSPTLRATGQRLLDEAGDRLADSRVNSHAREAGRRTANQQRSIEADESMLKRFAAFERTTTGARGWTLQKRVNTFKKKLTRREKDRISKLLREERIPDTVI